jgi:hypothetical protein
VRVVGRHAVGAVRLPGAGREADADPRGQPEHAHHGAIAEAYCSQKPSRPAGRRKFSSASGALVPAGSPTRSSEAVGDSVKKACRAATLSYAVGAAAVISV